MKNLKKQCCLLLVALFLNTALPLHTQTRLPKEISDEIIIFTLFNYDNLIADSYEKKHPYMTILSKKLNTATQLPETTILDILNSPSIRTEANAVQYMLKINQKILEKSGYYFVDT